MVQKEPDPIYYPNKDINLTDWVPALNDKIHVLKTHSWFDMNFVNNHENIRIRKHQQRVPIISSRIQKTTIGIF